MWWIVGIVAVFGWNQWRKNKYVDELNAKCIANRSLAQHAIAINMPRTEFERLYGKTFFNDFEYQQALKILSKAECSAKPGGLFSI
jgi:hypothetical protein